MSSAFIFLYKCVSGGWYSTQWNTSISDFMWFKNLSNDFFFPFISWQLRNIGGYCMLLPLIWLFMQLAQKLYEGIQLADGKAAGLITYPRTDGLHVKNFCLQLYLHATLVISLSKQLGFACCLSLFLPINYFEILFFLWC